MPEGYYFVIADVLIEPNHASLTTDGFVFARLKYFGLERFQDFKLSPDLSSQMYNFTAAPFVMDEGTWLAVENAPSSTVSIAVTVTGYLTDQPEKLRL